MATLNNAVATGFQGLWSYEAGQPSYTPIQNKVPRRNAIRRLMNRSQWRAVSELFDTLLGAAVGGAALASHTQVRHHSAFAGGGGNVAIESIEDINRNSSAADLAMLKEMTFGVKARPSYPRDLSGNGGSSFA